MSVPSENCLKSKVLLLINSSPNLSGIVRVLLSESSTNSKILQISDLHLIGDRAIFSALRRSAMVQTESSILMLSPDHLLHLVHCSVMELRLKKQRLIIIHHLLLSSLQVEIMDQSPILPEQLLTMVLSQVRLLQMVK